MTFEAGPWHCFGGQLLERIALAQQQLQNQQQPQVSGGSGGASGIIGSAVMQTPVSQSGNSIATTQMLETLKKPTFVPDFSAVVRDDCTYLEITAQTYLLAYKSTLISKGSRFPNKITHRFTLANIEPLNIDEEMQMEEGKKSCMNSCSDLNSYQSIDF